MPAPGWYPTCSGGALPSRRCARVENHPPRHGSAREPRGLPADPFCSNFLPFLIFRPWWAMAPDSHAFGQRIFSSHDPPSPGFQGCQQGAGMCESVYSCGLQKVGGSMSFSRLSRVMLKIINPMRQS